MEQSPTRTGTSRIRLPDLVDEVVAALVQRPMRSVLTMLGTVVGIASFVAVLGLTTSASGQVDKRFNRLVATEVVVEDARERPSSDEMAFPPDAESRALRLNGVRSAGVRWRVDAPALTISGMPGTASGNRGLNLFAVAPGALVATHPTIRSGRLYDDFHARRFERVAVLGPVAASELGISLVDGRRAVFLNGSPYLVLGILADVERLPELLSAVLVPSQTALAEFGAPQEERAVMLIETDPGAANQVAGEIPYALRPDAPSVFRVVGPPDPRGLRSGVASDLDALFLLLATLSLIAGTFGIANTTLISVLERTGEIGLRRALGARPVHVAAQFLAESGALGLVGGITGSAMGVLVVVVTAFAKSWTAILPGWTVVVAPAAGLFVGLLAGCYPALRAARIEPLEALRR